MAPLFVWSEKYSVGVQEMDEQHQQFLNLVNDVLDFINANHVAGAEPTKEKCLTLMKLIDLFGNYAMYHLSNEEEKLRAYSCRVAEKHIAVHDEFRKTIKDLISQVRASIPSASCPQAEQLGVFAGRWLLEHILIMDKGYTECFKQHGLH
jgi:hemerythrin